MNIMDLATMQILADAMQAAQKGDKRQALILADRYGVESAACFITADPKGLATIVAPLVDFYESLKEWELATLKSRDVCALVEKLCPDTTETAGDYTYLATALERLGDYAGAITALESAIVHLKGAGVWNDYEDGYKKWHSQLRQLESIDEKGMFDRSKTDTSIRKSEESTVNNTGKAEEKD